MSKKKTGKVGKRLKLSKRSKKKLSVSPGMLDQIADIADDYEEVVIKPSQGEKMSEIILRFARPLLDLTKDGDSYRRAVDMAIFVWNLSFLPRHEYDEEIEHLIKGNGLNEVDGQFLKRDLVKLIQRRLTEFPGIDKLVVSYEVLDTKSGYNLTVASMDVSERA